MDRIKVRASNAEKDDAGEGENTLFLGRPRPELLSPPISHLNHSDVSSRLLLHVGQTMLSLPSIWILQPHPQLPLQHPDIPNLADGLRNPPSHPFLLRHPVTY